MATSDGFGRQVLRYLESTRNLVGCGGGAVGLGLHFAGLGGAWWPAVVAGLYGAGALLTPKRDPRPGPDPELTALAEYLATVPLPASAGVAGLLAALRTVGPGPVPREIVRHRLPVAVAGYLRALTWRPWAGADAPDPEAELGREVRRLVAELD
ncbi:hypothetical protein P3T27_000859 [Kitasatospora sp. MAA19]|uniref:hypothetical protein n=1 Tax=Kitasatospora sp. MAA19 TaxID=3035090 RepID=UPI002473BBDD|nr:hypothetical protein [Kitasatospora sp. MAA19]MDH6704158.1 hypothetical protein [Kitasatospora sp. MAA19]